MMRLGIEPRSPGPLANTLPTRPMSRLYKDWSEKDVNHYSKYRLVKIGSESQTDI